MRVEIYDDGSGLTHGDYRPLRMNTQSEVWDWLIYTLAGVFAEARHRKVSAFAAMLDGGSGDKTQADAAIDWLVQNKCAASVDEAWRRAEDETRTFVREQWAAIERVALALIEHGALDADNLQALIEHASS